MPNSRVTLKIEPKFTKIVKFNKSSAKKSGHTMSSKIRKTVVNCYEKKTTVKDTCKWLKWGAVWLSFWLETNLYWEYLIPNAFVKITISFKIIQAIK